MEVIINANTLTTLAEVLTALGVIGGVVLWCIKFIQRSKRQHEELKAIRKEQTLICYGLLACLKGLKEQGLWVFGADAGGGTVLYDADLKGPAVIVIGSEGDGMGRLVREQCDFLVSIPMKGQLNSLNASAAAAVVLYEAVRQRG